VFSNAFVLQRAGRILTTVIGIAVVNFFLLQLAPGDAAQVLATEAGSATAEYLAALRHQFGLDLPVLTQFGQYLLRLLNFDLGYSHRFGMTVWQLVLDRLPATLLLMGSSICFAVIVGSAFGAIAAYRVGRLSDTLISGVALLFYATPLFWVGLMLIVVFSVWLDWFPVGGMISVEAGHAGLAYAKDVLLHLVLPALTLGLFYLAVYVRLMRSTILDVRRQDYVRTARAKGLSARRIFFQHVLRNALLPIITMLGVQVGSILGGAVLVETVFSWPGLGRLAFDALYHRDLNLLLGILLCSSLLVILINLLIDFIYTIVDPRIEHL
jgi:peptide/nickel transport system permease protein